MGCYSTLCYRRPGKFGLVIHGVGYRGLCINRGINHCRINQLGVNVRGFPIASGMCKGGVSLVTDLVTMHLVTVDSVRTTLRTASLRT